MECSKIRGWWEGVQTTGYNGNSLQTTKISLSLEFYKVILINNLIVIQKYRLYLNITMKCKLQT